SVGLQTSVKSFDSRAFRGISGRHRLYRPLSQLPYQRLGAPPDYGNILASSWGSMWSPAVVPAARRISLIAARVWSSNRPVGNTVIGGFLLTSRAFIARCTVRIRSSRSLAGTP